MDKSFILKWKNNNPPIEEVFDASDWKEYLSSYKQNGLKLKRFSSLGNTFVYHVFYFGAPKGLVKEIKGTGGSIFNLFPGYDDTLKPKKIIKYGLLK